MICLADAQGIVRQYAYDPWGKRRLATDWTKSDDLIHILIDRGYTGHEHLDAFGIINMNGRVYDPATASFLSPDAVLTDAGNWLNYNRYSYCNANPFKYTDPSGNSLWSWIGDNWKGIVTTVVAVGVAVGIGILTGGAGFFAAGVLAGVAGGFTSGVLGTALNGGVFNQCMGAGIIGSVIGGFAGAAGGMAALGVGGAIGSSFGGFFAGALQGVAGGFASGSVGAWMGGASFEDGLTAGLIGAAVGGLVGGVWRGIDAVSKGADFLDGTIEFDLSKGVGATNIRADILKQRFIKAVASNNTYRGVNVFESALLGDASESGGIAFPEKGIVVGRGVNASNYPKLFQHEFGHILQYRLIQQSLDAEAGLERYYRVIGMNSLASATKETISFGAYNHGNFWTETWANYLSQQNIGGEYILDAINYPVKNIDAQIYQRLFGK